jgi:hypothetical protein
MDAVMGSKEKVELFLVVAGLVAGVWLSALGNPLVGIAALLIALTTTRLVPRVVAPRRSKSRNR